MNELLNDAVEVASELLESNGEFEPFALALLGDGKILHLEAENADGNEVDSDQLVEHLLETLRERLPELRATAVVADVTLENEDAETVTSAIAVQMEHINDEPVTCFLAYEFRGDALELADLVSEPGERYVFPAQMVN